MRIYYNQNLIKLARKLRNDSTQSEIKLWGFLKGKKMLGYSFQRQKPINNFIVDFFCNKLKLVIELDGYTHDFVENYDKDLKKEDELKKIGLNILRFDDREVMNDIENVLRTIEFYILDFEKKQPPNPLY
jgi:very-short-patch-repair endonuclease